MSSDKKRKPNWSEEQNLLLTRLVEENKSVLLGKFGPGVTALKKKERLAGITDTINASFPGCTRTMDEVEKKWHNIQSKAKNEISHFKRGAQSTGGGPTCCPTLSATSEVVWDIIGHNNVSISGISGATDSTLIQVSDKIDISDMTFLDCQTLKAMGWTVTPECLTQASTVKKASSSSSSSTCPLQSGSSRQPQRQIFLYNEERNFVINSEASTGNRVLKKQMLEINLKKTLYKTSGIVMTSWNVMLFPQLNICGTIG